MRCYSIAQLTLLNSITHSSSAWSLCVSVRDFVLFHVDSSTNNSNHQPGVYNRGTTSSSRVILRTRPLSSCKKPGSLTTGTLAAEKRGLAPSPQKLRARFWLQLKKPRRSRKRLQKRSLGSSWFCACYLVFVTLLDCVVMPMGL